MTDAPEVAAKPLTIEDMPAFFPGGIADKVRFYARLTPDARAMMKDDQILTYGAFDAMADRIAASLQRDGVVYQDTISICAKTSIEYGCVYFGALRAGVGVAPLAPSSTPDQLVAMVADSGAKIYFVDQTIAAEMGDKLRGDVKAKIVTLDGSAAGTPLNDWLAPAGAAPEPVEIDPEAVFDIIYSSGTTGTPKGIVHPHTYRGSHTGGRGGLGGASGQVSIISTPLYSNTTLVSFLPALASGAAVVLMEKFDVEKFLKLSEKYRVTHAMLVPVQYRRLLEHPDFDKYDLSSFVMKFSTSAPFPAAIKADVLKRWPGGLIEFFGMTEGGGGTMLVCHQFPDKLHTVGMPQPGVDLRLIDEDGKQVAQGEIGEIVGHSAGMMKGYKNQPGKTEEAWWYDETGKKFMRFGDVGRFDEDGFLQLMDRKKDMIISGGFNVYPSDIEAIMMTHGDLLEVAVVGVESDRWGETPVAYVTLKPGVSLTAEAIKVWTNNHEKVGKTQRLHDVILVDALPRSPIGKVLKRELRDEYKARFGIAA